jgi:hypothetical protein
MAFVEPTRIEVKLLKPDLALASIGDRRLPNFQSEGGGQHTTMDLQKFGNDWKIVASHTSSSEMCNDPPPR